ncbi:plasmid partitioning protein RepB [Chachezhania sediminis]|uniref:plasmid partitioning protein RepB n=1 Tax=Chachezhania sediminis TaxID=2599291 RepID=UPI001E335FEB|nr:plasmid partitioning protein RepB [Chachezhania sediminis]
MGRKIFSAAEAAQDASPAAAKRQGFGGSVGGLRDSLREITANSIRDIDPDRIEQDGLRDRLAMDESGIVELAESIRRHGQQVPILVRPTGEPDRYRIIYGRRRLAAIRRIGGPVKAIVRTLDDEASIIAQGQENNLRLDPSFIEKALFIREMQETGYKPQVIQDALGLSRQGVSNHKVVLDTLPDELIRLIGPAHGIGRRQWGELATLAAEMDLLTVARDMLAGMDPESDSVARFHAVMDAGKIAMRKPREATAPDAAQRALLTVDGNPLGDLQRKKDTISLSVSLRDHPEFGQWIEEQAEDILQSLLIRWKDETGRQ